MVVDREITKRTGEAESKFISEALKRYALGRSFIRPEYKKAEEDIRFSMGDGNQWTADAEEVMRKASLFL